MFNFRGMLIKKYIVLLYARYIWGNSLKTVFPAIREKVECGNFSPLPRRAAVRVDMTISYSKENLKIHTGVPFPSFPPYPPLPFFPLPSPPFPPSLPSYIPFP